jgi:hypothetical protein
MNELVMLDGPETRAAEIEAFKAEFLRYAAMPDLSRPCPVGQLTGDRMRGDLARQQIWQVVADAMSDKDSFTRRAVVILCNVAVDMRQEQAAKELLNDMAEHWADLRCDL